MYCITYIIIASAIEAKLLVIATMYRFHTRVLILGTVLTITLILTIVMLDYHHRNRMLAIEDARLNGITEIYIHFPKLSARGFKENMSSVGPPWDWEYYRAVREVLRVSSTVDTNTDGIPDIARESLNPNVVERGKVSILIVCPP